MDYFYSVPKFIVSNLLYVFWFTLKSIENFGICIVFSKILHKKFKLLVSISKSIRRLIESEFEIIIIENYFIRVYLMYLLIFLCTFNDKSLHSISSC